jgi:hypothetical protein
MVPFGKLIEVAFDQNGTESAEAHDFRSGLDRAGCRFADASDAFVHVRGFEAVGWNEGVNVDAVSGRAGCGGDVNVADGSGRNPREDIPDLLVRQRRVLWSAQHTDYGGGGSPTFLMADQSEIDVGRLRLRSYTGN